MAGLSRICRMLAALLAAMLFMGCAADTPIEDTSGGGTEPAPELAARIAFINVGKADAALISAAGGHYLVDTGTKDSHDALVAALNALGVEELDGVFITHKHDDHLGGLKKLSEKMGIARVYCAEISDPTGDGEHKIVKRAEKQGLPYTLLNAGDTLAIGAGELAILGPVIQNSDDDNDNSLVMMLTVAGVKALFTGDMQFAEEQTLMDAGAELAANILKVGNHGNPDATSDAFAAAVDPRYAVISTDTNEDGDSANPRVTAALGDAEIAVTQDARTAVIVEIYTDGSVDMRID